MPAITEHTKHTLTRLTQLQEKELFCFHGSQRNINGFLRPHRARGRSPHERHHALYASTDIRPAIVKALLTPAGDCGDFTWGWHEEEDVFLLNGSNMQFRPGYIYIFDRSNFTPSGSTCETEVISKSALICKEKIQVEPELLEHHDGILIGPSHM